MNEYPKIQTVFKRDPETKYKTLLDNEFSTPELQYLAQNEWVFTEKVDGTNIRIISGEGELTFKGKTDKAEIPPFLLEALKDIFEPRFTALGEKFPEERVCLYGEGYGPKIQKGGKYSVNHGFVLFDVKYGPWWLKREDVEDVALHLGIEVAPVIGRGTLFDMVGIAKAGMESVWGDFQAEGIVARPAQELFARNGNRIITKIKTKDFQ